MTLSTLEYRIDIDASPEVVYRYLTEREGLLAWMAVDATVDGVPGGTLRWVHENGATMVGRFITLEPPRRVVFSYGWEGGLMGVPPESTTVEVRLVERGTGTQVELIHRDLPDEASADHLSGWQHFLAELAAIASDRDPAATPPPTTVSDSR